MTIDEQIEILRAVKEGKKIEAKPQKFDEPWLKWEGPCNFDSYNYRVIQEPRRFIIFKLNRIIYAQPYGDYVPGDAKIICTAVEEENVGTEALAQLGTEIAG